MTRRRSFPFLSVLLPLLLLILGSMEQSSARAADSEPSFQRHRQLVGGYTPIATIEGNAALYKAAAWAVAALHDSQRTSPTDTETTTHDLVDTQSKSQRPDYTFLSALPQHTATSDIRILRAFQQVVAGLNYRMVIAIMSSSSPSPSAHKAGKAECVGAFAVTVYDHFGDLSVTQWGDQISCARAMAALQNQELMSDAHAGHFDG